MNDKHMMMRLRARWGRLAACFNHRANPNPWDILALRWAVFILEIRVQLRRDWAALKAWWLA